MTTGAGRFGTVRGVASTAARLGLTVPAVDRPFAHKILTDGLAERQIWRPAGPLRAESDMRKTRNIERVCLHAVAATERLTRKTSASTSDSVAMDCPGPITRPCWRDRAASVRFAREGPSVGSRSIIVIRPERCEIG